MQIKMKETLDVSPNGIHVATFAKQNVYTLNEKDEREADLAQFLLDNGHAEEVAPDDTEISGDGAETTSDDDVKTGKKSGKKA